MTQRRTFLKVIGGGIVLAAGGAGAFLATRTPTRALAPWSSTGEYSEPRKNALSYAILAPNPHNRQPWLVDLDVPEQVIIYRDKSKNLPETDPYDRQLTIGMGCFAELMAIAASQTGHAVDFEFFPKAENGPVAIAQFKQGAMPDPLFAQILSRRSCKEPFEDRLPPTLNELRAFCDIHTDNALVSELQKLSWDAWMIESLTYRTMKESTDLFRLGKAQVEANPDGIDFSGPFFETLILTGQFTREGALDPKSTEFAQGAEIYKKMMFATPAYAVIRTPGNTREDQIAAGRAWLRLNLTTTALGLSLHPVSQALQEYPEMAESHAKAHGLLAKAGETVQMLGRLGYGPKVPPSPRWPLEAKVING